MKEFIKLFLLKTRQHDDSASQFVFVTRLIKSSGVKSTEKTPRVPPGQRQRFAEGTLLNICYRVIIV